MHMGSNSPTQGTMLEVSPTLPVEITINILSFLDAKDLSKCRLLSTYYDLLVRETPSLRLITELGIGGYEGGPRSSLNTAERLDALQNVHQRWRNPQPVVRRAGLDVPLPADWRVRTWMVVDGIFVRQSGLDDDDRDVEFYTRIDFVNLHEVVQTTHWKATTMYFPMKTLDLYLDIEQDLIILTGTELTYPLHVYLMSYRNGKPHPRVDNFILTIPSPVPSSEYAICVQEVVGDLLLVAVEPKDSEMPTIHLYRWPSSTLIKSWVSSKTHIYEDVVMPVPGYLLVLGYICQPDAMALEPMVQVFAISPPFGSSQDINFLAQFTMPMLHGVGPSSTFWTAHNESADRSSNFDFCTSRYTLLHIRLANTYSVFTPLRTFLSDIVKARAPDPTSAPLHFTWLEWGPKCTRYLYQPDADIILAGYHVILANEVWDFSPRGVSHFYDATQGPIQGKLIAEPTVTSRQPHHDDQVVTYLPYREMTLDLPATENGQSHYLRYLAENSAGPQLVQIALKNPMVVDIVTF